MMTLDEAWRWYETNRAHLQSFARVGAKYWDELPWDGALGRDDRLRLLESAVIVEGSQFCLEHLEDFAVLILFSVFESIVRDKVCADVHDEKGRLSNALLIQIVEGAISDIEHGSFFRVLDVFKGQDADLVEEVNQVRRYRNWVAHGRRTSAPAAVDPESAFLPSEAFSRHGSLGGRDKGPTKCDVTS
jgi:hypothetical protein